MDATEQPNRINIFGAVVLVLAAIILVCILLVFSSDMEEKKLYATSIAVSVDCLVS